jgi:hypothetical protein
MNCFQNGTYRDISEKLKKIRAEDAVNKLIADFLKLLPDGELLYKRFIK